MVLQRQLCDQLERTTTFVAVLSYACNGRFTEHLGISFDLLRRIVIILQILYIMQESSEFYNSTKHFVLLYNCRILVIPSAMSGPRRMKTMAVVVLTTVALVVDRPSP